MADIISSTTQQFLDIHDITNNFVIMKDGTASVILAVDAMNFGLLAEEEQDAVMYAYAGLLNSLNYTVQIVINSQTKDVTTYLQLLKDQESSASNETIRRRIRQYREFVGNLIHDRNVLDKKFYVVIPANSIELGFAGAKSVLPGSSKFDISAIERSMLLEKAQNILDPRRDHMIAQFARIGLFSRQLSTQEIIQLFYIQYNPEAAEGQQIGESSSYSSPLVQASIQGLTMNADFSVPPTVGSAPSQTQIPQATAPEVLPPQPQPIPDTSAIDGMGNVLGQPTMPPQPDMTAGTQESAASILDTPAPTPEMPVVSIPESTAVEASVPSSTPQSSVTPVETPITPIATAQPPVTTEQTPIVSAMPTAPISTTSGAPFNNDASIEADLNESIKQMGIPGAAVVPVDNSSESEAIPSAATTIAKPPITPGSSTSTAIANQSGDLPPLPEI